MNNNNEDLTSNEENKDDPLDDPLGDLGDLDDFGTDDEDEDMTTMTNRPYRAAEKIFFVPVEPFKIMNDVPSNVVQNDMKTDTPEPKTPQSNNSIDRKNNKNIHFTKMDDNGNDTPIINNNNSPTNNNNNNNDIDNAYTNIKTNNINSSDYDNYDNYNTDTNYNTNYDDPYGPGQIDLNYSSSDEDDESDSESDNESDMESSYSENEDFDMDININNNIRPDTKQKRRSINNSENKDENNSENNSENKPFIKRGDSARNLNLRKFVSSFNPKEFDICLLVSLPLTIKTKSSFNIRRNNKSARISRAYTNRPGSSKYDHENLLEYIRSSLPDRLELQQTVRQTLVRRNIEMRYGHFTATQEAIKQLNKFGGCKVLQFVAYCCNPKKDKQLYPELCKSLEGYPMDMDYILLETEVGHQGLYDDEGICCFGKGIWYSRDQLYAILNSQITQIDCIIAISPQHERLTSIFKYLGYNYIIGVEAPNNNHPFSTTETSAFLDQLYAALLERRSVSRAYYLSLQAAFTSRGSVRGGNDSDPKYIYYQTKNMNYDRFILFDNTQLKIGEINDKSQHEKLPKTNLREPIRPFIGRSEYVIELLKKLTDTQIVNVPGKELIGRASVVKSTTRYLLQMGFFRGGCFVIDCKLQSKKYHSNKTKTFNECVYDVLKSCGVDFRTQPDILEGNDDVLDEGDIPQMNNVLNTPALIGHYSQRSSSRFPNFNVKDLDDIDDDMDDMNNSNTDEDIPVINKEFGDPKHSPRSLFEYLENSIFYDQKPPSHEPFCFVILNMNHWHNGSDKVTEWITKFSQQLFKKEDSRIICTGNDTLNILNVSTLNMKELSSFSPRKLAKLFKYFCHDFESKFNPSINEIAKHKELQSIFDGRPGMTKKVSQYVRYLFISIESESDNNDDYNAINLGEIAKNYPVSTYAVHLKDKKNIIPAKYSTSVPSNIGNPRKSCIDDSIIQLNTEGHLSINDSSQTSTPKFATNNTNNTSDPSVLIPDTPIKAKGIGILPPDNNKAGWSPPVSYQQPYTRNNMYYQQQQQYARNNMYYQSQPQQPQQPQQQQQQGYPMIPPPPPPQSQPYNNNTYYNNNNNYKNSYNPYIPMQPTSRLFNGNTMHSHAAQQGSQSLSQLNKPYSHTNKINTSTTITLQTTTYTTASNSNPSIPTNILRYGSIENPNALKNKTSNKKKHNADVKNLFTNTNNNNNNNGIQTNKSQRLPLNNNTKQSFTFIISDANNVSRDFSGGLLPPISDSHSYHGYGRSTDNTLQPSHKLRNLNESISTPMQPPQHNNKLSDENEQMEKENNEYNITCSPIGVSRQNTITNTTIITDYMLRQGSINVNAPPNNTNITTNIISFKKDINTSRRSSSVPDVILRSGSLVVNGKEANLDAKEKENKQSSEPNRKSHLEMKQPNQILPGHSLEFSTLTEISVLNEQISVETADHNHNLIAFNNIRTKNDSFLVSPQPSITSQISMDLSPTPTPTVEGGLSTGNIGLKGVQSAPLTYDTQKLTSGNKIYEPMAKTDCAIIGINHSYSARKIWLNSCLSTNNNIAKLTDLFPHLIQEFKRLTRCDTRQPTLQQIELFFVRTGGLYNYEHESLPFIQAVKFDKFFAWFRSMCSIIKDLRPMYNRAEDPLIGLFYGRTTAQETLEHKPEGTFILRLASQQNGLAITYKNPNGKIQNVLLTRISQETYRVGKSDKETLLFNLIRPWDKLKYLYTPNKLIRKKLIF